jgi:hypothetical protein
MSKESKALLKEFHSIVDYYAADLMIALKGRQGFENPLLRLDKDDLNSISSISLTIQQVKLLQRCMEAMGQGVVFSILSIIDGVADVDEKIPDLAIVNRQTKEEITDQFWHDQFVDLLSD